MNNKVRNIRLVVLDVDGTLTDGGVYINNNGIESKKFNIKDGAGIVLAQGCGYEFMILTGRTSNCVDIRAKELNIKYVYQGVKDKLSFLKNILEEIGIKKDQVAYVGDDINDIDCMKYVALSACPLDAVNKVKDYVDIVIPVNGGMGAVRYLCDLLIDNGR